MKILDCYITLRFISRLIWALGAATLIFVVVDNVENLDRFIDSQVPLTRVLRYYLLYLPYIIYLVLPVATLLATLFTIGEMTTSNELTAIHTAGVPFIRPLFLLLVVASFAAFGAFSLGESIIPAANRERMDIYRYEVKRIPRETRTNMGRLYFQYGIGKHIYIDRYISTTREAYNVELVEISDGKILSRIATEKMVWRNGKWILQSPQEQRFQSNGDIIVTSLNESDLGFSYIKPDELEKVQTAPEELNYNELKDFIRRQKFAGGAINKWEVDLLFKVSLPAAAVIIVIFGAPIAAVHRRGGPMLGFGIALFICFIYYGFIQIGKVIGYNGLISPLLSAWAGNIVFGSLGIILLLKRR